MSEENERYGDEPIDLGYASRTGSVNSRWRIVAALLLGLTAGNLIITALVLSSPHYLGSVEFHYRLVQAGLDLTIASVVTSLTIIVFVPRLRLRGLILVLVNLAFCSLLPMIRY